MGTPVPPAASGRRVGWHRPAGSGAVDQRHRLRADHLRHGLLSARESPVARAGTGRHRDHRGVPALEHSGVPFLDRLTLRPIDAPRLDPIGDFPPARRADAPAVGDSFYRASRADPLSGHSPDRHRRPAAAGAAHPAAGGPVEACGRIWRRLIHAPREGADAQQEGLRDPDRGQRHVGAVPVRYTEPSGGCTPGVGDSPECARRVWLSPVGRGRAGGGSGGSRRGIRSRLRPGGQDRGAALGVGADYPIRGVRRSLPPIHSRHRTARGHLSDPRPLPAAGVCAAAVGGHVLAGSVPVQRGGGRVGCRQVGFGVPRLAGGARPRQLLGAQEPDYYQQSTSSRVRILDLQRHLLGLLRVPELHPRQPHWWQNLQQQRRPCLFLGSDRRPGKAQAAPGCDSQPDVAYNGVDC